MKKTIISMLSAVGLLFSSCADFTDIDHKGSNLLKSVDELEMLLNYEFANVPSTDVQILAGDIYPQTFIPTVLSRPQKTTTSILIKWDEAGHAKEQIEQTQTDELYTQFYYYIGRISNPILMNIDGASGDPVKKAQIKAEALVLRAYFHYILVQRFAKAYDPAYAAEEMAIPYLKEDQDLLATIPQLTLEQVYTNILADIDEAIALNALPSTPANHMRSGLAFAYAVKAMTLMSMQNYTDAAEAADKSLALNPTVSDYNNYLTAAPAATIIKRPFMDCEEDLFVFRSILNISGVSDEAWNRFEDKHITRDCLETEYALTGRHLGLALIGLDIPITYSFSPGWNNFGLKSSQMLLILAECEIRKGNIGPAMGYLDRIRSKRILADSYAPIQGTVSTKEDAIKRLKQCAHGENVFTYFNFVDRKRWNLLPDFKETLTRTVDGADYTLSPDSPLWIFPFPQNVISRNPSIKQNY